MAVALAADFRSDGLLLYSGSRSGDQSPVSFAGIAYADLYGSSFFKEINS